MATTDEEQEQPPHRRRRWSNNDNNEMEIIMIELAFPFSVERSGPSEQGGRDLFLLHSLWYMMGARNQFGWKSGNQPYYQQHLISNLQVRFHWRAKTTNKVFSTDGWWSRMDEIWLASDFTRRKFIGLLVKPIFMPAPSMTSVGGSSSSSSLWSTTAPHLAWFGLVGLWAAQWSHCLSLVKMHFSKVEHDNDKTIDKVGAVDVVDRKLCINSQLWQLQPKRATPTAEEDREVEEEQDNQQQQQPTWGDRQSVRLCQWLSVSTQPTRIRGSFEVDIFVELILWFDQRDSGGWKPLPHSGGVGQESGLHFE